MKLEEVIKLIDAGYTKEDIQGMLQPASQPAEEPTPEPAPSPKPEDPVLKELQELRKAVKAMTIVTGAAEKPTKTSVDDVLDKLSK